MSINIADYMERRWANAEAELERAHLRLLNTLKGYAALNVAGFNTGELGEWEAQYPVFTKVDKKDFQAIHKALGKLENAGVEPIGDGRSRMVRVHLKPKDENYRHFSFYFNKQLAKDAKCKIVTRVNKEKVLVCDK